MKMGKYCLYVVESDSEFDKSVAGYEDVKEYAIEHIKADDFKSLLNFIISGFNSETLSDQYWYYITDEEEGIIIMY